MGKLVVGETVDVMYVDQNREGLDDPEMSVFDAVTDGADEITLGPRTINRQDDGFQCFNRACCCCCFWLLSLLGRPTTFLCPCQTC